MNFIDEIKAFHDLTVIKSLSTGQIALWYALFNINNKCAWIEWFTVANQTLELTSGLSKSGVAKCRNVLKQYNLIDFKPNGTKSTSYKMYSITNSNQVSNQVSNRISERVSNQDSNRISERNGNTINRLDETKLNETKENDTTHARVREECVSDRFDEFWKAYPKKTAKDTARKAFVKIKPDDELLQTMLDAIDKQKQSQQWTKDAGQYIPNPATWLNQKRWEDEIVVDNNQKPDFSDVSRYDDLTMDFKKE